MAEMKISNTLVNDTKDGVIAYALQVKDTSLDRFLSDINLELLTNIDLKDYNTTTKKHLPKSAKDCTFEYDGEAVYVVPNMYNNVNNVLVYAYIYKDNQEVEKLFIISDTEIINIWEGSNIPEWAINYLPTTIANKLTNMANQIAEIEESVTWNSEEQ